MSEYIEELIREQTAQQARDELAAAQEATRLAQIAFDAELERLAKLAEGQ